MIELNGQSPPLMNPKLIGENSKETEHFRATRNNFANIQVSAQIRDQDDGYEYCPNCNRKFFSGRLQLHLKSCKEGKPLKPLKAKPLANNTQLQKDIPLSSNRQTDDYHQPDLRAYEKAAYKDEENFEPSFGEHSHTPIISPQKTVNMKSPATKAKEYDDYEPKGYEKGMNNFENEAAEDDAEENSPNNLEENERPDGEEERVQCGVCGRSFHPDRVAKHEKACKKSNKKRPVFDTTKQRLVPEQAELVGGKPTKKAAAPQKEKVVVAETPAVEGNHKEEGGNKKVPAWKAEHENFIKNIRYNRKLKDMEAKGEDTSHLVAPTIVNENYVPCPHCSRKFAPATAERHIPKCKNTFNRPKPPKGLKIDKLEDTQKNERIDRSKTQFILRKGTGPRRGSETEQKGAVTPTSQQTNFNLNDKTASHRSPQSTLSTGNYEQQLDDVMKDKLTPKESSKMSKTQTRLPLKKTNSVEYTAKTQTILPDIKKPELESHEIKLSETRGRDFRSQSPGSKEEKKVFMEPMPKKDELLQNYQGLASRATTYSTDACPHCQRKFSKHAAERHIPVCKSVMSRLPRKSGERDSSAGAKAKMYMTNFGTKIGFKNGTGEKEDASPLNPRQTGVHATNYDQFPVHERMKQSDRPPLPGKKALGETSEGVGAEKPPLAKPKMAATGTSFCTSCGCKSAKTHKFCGNCGLKK